jgi:hypothetical protein
MARSRQRGLAAVRIGIARVLARPTRSLLVALGIAAATAMLVGVFGGSLIAQDRLLQRSVEELPVSQRTFRVDLIGLPGERSYAESDRVARRALAPLTPAQPLRVVYFRDAWLDSEFVRLVAADRLARVVRLQSGRLPRTCSPAACEVVQIGNRGRPVLSEGGINLVRVGIGELRDPAVYGPAFSGLRRLRAQRSIVTSTVLLPPDAASFQRIPALQLLFQVRSWVAPIDPSALHSWQIDDVLRRESQAQTTLEQTDLAFSFSGPDAALIAARDSGKASAQRMVLIGGGVSALLLGFALVAAISLRRGLALERRRLVLRGATRAQLRLALGTEIGLITLAGWLIGVVAGVLAVAGLAGLADLPVGAIVTHTVLRPWALLSLVLSLVVATAVVLIAASGREASASARRIRLLDVAAVGAALAVVVGLARGGLSADKLTSGGDPTFLLLLPGLVCFVGAVVATRLLRPVMLLGERLSRRGPIAVRLALLALARAPTRTLATVGFLVVAVALALFAAGYRATLDRQAEDEAAFAVPLDVTLSQGPKLQLPLDVAPIQRFSRLGPDVRAYPVLRRSADIAGLGSSAQSVSVLGLSPEAFASMHWRSDFSSTRRSKLVQSVNADGLASIQGPTVPAGTTELTLPLRLRGSRLRVDLALRDTRGRIRVVPLGLARQGRSLLTARLAAREALKIVGLELSLPTVERDWYFHNDIEGRTVVAPAGTLTLGPLDAAGDDGRALPVVSWRGWVVRGRGARMIPGGAPRVAYSFPEVETLVVRPREPTDGIPLRVVASPDVARSAGSGGQLTLDFQDARLPARIVGVADRFPTVGGGGPFVVAEESRLATMLDADAPGTGTPGEVWLALPHGAASQVATGLSSPPFSQLAQASRRALVDRADDDPLARGVVYTLGISALVALALAFLAFALAMLSELRDERGNFFDLEAQGVAPETLRSHLRVRALALAGFGLLGGCLLGLVLSRVVVSLVQVTARTSSPEPPLVFTAGWTVLAPLLAGFLLLAVVAAELGTRRAFRGDVPRRALWSLD